MAKFEEQLLEALKLATIDAVTLFEEDVKETLAYNDEDVNVVEESTEESFDEKIDKLIAELADE